MAFHITSYNVVSIDGIAVYQPYARIGIGQLLYKEFGSFYNENCMGFPIRRVFLNPVAEYAFRKAVSLGWIDESSISNEEYVLRMYDDKQKELWQELNQKLPEKYRVSKKKRLQRKIRTSHDYGSRDFALAYINGKVYSASTHSKCINKFLREQNQVELQLAEDWMRPDNIDSSIEKMAFAHLVMYDNSIYVEEKSLINMTIDEAANAFKVAYPAYKIYNDDVLAEDPFDEDGNFNEYKLLVSTLIKNK